VERLTGSLAFGAVARIVLLATKTEGEKEPHEGRRLLIRAKSNIGEDGGGFEYDLEQRVLPQHPGITTSAVRWGRAVEGTARELLGAAEATDGEDGDSVTEAMDWLRDVLAEGPVEPQAIKSRAKAAAHSWATVQRAKKRLGIKSRKQGMKDGWTWELPRRCSSSPEDAHPKSESTFGPLEHLRPGDDEDDRVDGVL
jgi:hypothetical protein